MANRMTTADEVQDQKLRQMAPRLKEVQAWIEEVSPCVRRTVKPVGLGRFLGDAGRGSATVWVVYAHAERATKCTSQHKHMQALNTARNESDLVTCRRTHK